MAKSGRTVTLRDVAARCDVSVATVSAVVNGLDWVTEATRERVQAALDEMGYRRNEAARGLRLRRSNAIGVVAGDLTNPFWTELVRALSHELHETGRSLLLGDADQQFGLASDHIQRLLGEQLAGLVILGDVLPPDQVRELARRSPVPVVVIEGAPVDGVHSLLVDTAAAAYGATRHLIANGYRRIAIIGGPSEGPGSASHAGVQRYEGYRRALLEAGRTPDPRLLEVGNFRPESGRDAMHRLLALRQRPDAVLAFNDMMALGAMHVLHERGLRVPEDVALVGFDDIPMAALASPSLTTVAMPIRELARAAAELLRERPARASPRAASRRFDAQLVVRESSGSERTAAA
jgi:LacI family transcriptional regulator